ncbi:pnp [Symbiodinium sp. CCMP2592]|nr:pnp [Symbiodinium sp. CCMP2592]
MSPSLLGSFTPVPRNLKGHRAKDCCFCGFFWPWRGLSNLSKPAPAKIVQEDEDAAPPDVKLHNIYKGQVRRFLEYGAIISLGGKAEGWIDPRELQESGEWIRAADHLKRKQSCFVRVIGVGEGLLRLSMRDVDQRTGKARRVATVQRELSTPRKSRIGTTRVRRNGSSHLADSLDEVFCSTCPLPYMRLWGSTRQDGDDKTARLLHAWTNTKFDDLFRDIQDRFETARQLSLAAFDNKDWMTATLASSKALWMLELAAGLFVAKVRYRRAVASEKLGHLMQSLEDAESVLRIKPDSEAMCAMRTRVVWASFGGIFPRHQSLPGSTPVVESIRAAMASG